MLTGRPRIGLISHGGGSPQATAAFDDVDQLLEQGAFVAEHDSRQGRCVTAALASHGGSGAVGRIPRRECGAMIVRVRTFTV